MGKRERARLSFRGALKARTRNPAASSVGAAGFRVRCFASSRNDRLVAKLALGVAGLALVALAWEIGWHMLGPFVLPAPAATAETLARLIADGAAWPALRVTITSALGGFVAGAALGTGLGVAAGLAWPLGAALRPVMTVTLGTPPIAWVVLALLWFGPRGGAAAFTVLVTAAPIVFAGAVQGVAARDRTLAEMARVYGAPPLLRLRALLLPQLLDHLLPALATALAFSWKVAVMAEVLAGGVGIGGRIADARSHLDLAETMAWILLAVMLLLVCDAVLLAPVRRRLAGRRPAVERLDGVGRGLPSARPAAAE